MLNVQSLQSLLLHHLRITDFPAPVEPGLQWAVHPQGNEPALARNGLHPVVFGAWDQSTRRKGSLKNNFTFWKPMHPAWPRCENSEYPDIPAFSRLARRAPQHPKLRTYFFVNPKSRPRSAEPTYFLNPQMPFEELDHFVISQLQLRYTTVVDEGHEFFVALFFQ